MMAAFAAFVVLGTGFTFYCNVGQGLELSDKGSDWASFGSYFGGVAGALLSFFSVLLLIITVWLQSSQIKQASEDSKNLELLGLVTRADNEIEQWLKIRPAKKSIEGDIEFSLIVWGLVDPSYINPKEFKSAFNRLISLTEMYCAAIELCATSELAIIDQHKRKCLELHAFLNKNWRTADSNRYDEITAIKVALEKLA
ncbi:hypothetical protein [Vibrio parahaemolyticus]|uniref:hypothetical protein n=1 Tax=Vibrio parahaemolyticus TaxID=670 RepID=UPI0011209B8F|nr:hypothetical protein [Vibrio parahaemolyticus]TOL87873.1 hypothetical protein CGH88_23895 [Vibrio parahaemolyticus]